MNTQLGLWNEWGRFFDEFNRRDVKFSPAVDVEETDSEFRIDVDLPGVPKKEVSIELDGDSLRIRGERRSAREDEKKGARYVERVTGKFERVLRIPQTVNRDTIEAKFEDGVLHLVLPKAELAKPRTIQVN